MKKKEVLKNQNVSL